eukprot:6178910-Pleurochrysis_carterae.AAC.2
MENPLLLCTVIAFGSSADESSRRSDERKNPAANESQTLSFNQIREASFQKCQLSVSCGQHGQAMHK